METKVIYCDKCGEYLGDLVGGVFYKFGKVVTEPHQCVTEPHQYYKEVKDNESIRDGNS